MQSICSHSLIGTSESLVEDHSVSNSLGIWTYLTHLIHLDSWEIRCHAEVQPLSSPASCSLTFLGRTSQMPSPSSNENWPISKTSPIVTIPTPLQHSETVNTHILPESCSHPEIASNEHCVWWQWSEKKKLNSLGIPKCRVETHMWRTFVPNRNQKITSRQFLPWIHPTTNHNPPGRLPQISHVNFGAKGSAGNGSNSLSIWKPSFPLDCRNKQLGLTILRPRWSAVHMRNIAKKINSQFERLARFPPRSVAVQSTNTLGTQKWSTIPREPAKMTGPPLVPTGSTWGHLWAISIRLLGCDTCTVCQWRVRAWRSQLSVEINQIPSMWVVELLGTCWDLHRPKPIYTN